jgi:hypothetical protein
MRLPHGERRLVLDERVTNLSGDTAHFTWGHHCVLGPPLVGAGAPFESPHGRYSIRSRPPGVHRRPAARQPVPVPPTPGR